jgi:hypothetical protein
MRRPSEIAAILQNQPSKAYPNRVGNRAQNMRRASARRQRKGCSVLERMKILPERRERRNGMKQQHEPVGQPRRETDYKSDYDRQLHYTDRINRRRTKPPQEIEMLINRRRMIWPNEFVDCPDEHGNKNRDAQDQQRDADAIAIIKRIHAGMSITLC